MNVLEGKVWARKKAAVAAESKRKVKALRKAGHAFQVEILGPRELDQQTPVCLAAVVLELDWKLAVRLEMVDDARNFITRAVMLGTLDPGLPPILAGIIEGRGLYEHGIGEFFLLYGKFEQKHGTSGKRTRESMMELINGCRHYIEAVY